VPAFRAEGAAIASSDGALGRIVLTAKSLALLVTVSRELVQDADDPNIGNALANAFAAQYALALDKAALYSVGSTTLPYGIKSTAGIATSNLGVNGLAPTNFDFIVNGVGVLQDLNENPNAIIYSPRTARELALLKDSQLRYLTPPPFLDEIPRYATNQVPNNLTVGTGTTCSYVFIGAFEQLLVGVREQFNVTVLNEALASTGSVGFLLHSRVDVQVARPAAFNVISGIL
jgi:HK97 family phage major capsid protein